LRPSAVYRRDARRFSAGRWDWPPDASPLARPLAARRGELGRGWSCGPAARRPTGVAVRPDLASIGARTESLSASRARPTAPCRAMAGNEPSAAACRLRVRPVASVPRSETSRRAAGHFACPSLPVAVRSAIREGRPGSVPLTRDVRRGRSASISTPEVAADRVPADFPRAPPSPSPAREERCFARPRGRSPSSLDRCARPFSSLLKGAFGSCGAIRIGSR
jgi:hypothetical protein